MWPSIVFERDGNQICAHLNDFVNLQVSPAGFGSAIKNAVMDLLAQRKLHCHKATWSGMGLPAGTCDEPSYSDDTHPNTLAMMLCSDTARCPKHGGLDVGTAAALAIYYRTDDANKAQALEWEIELEAHA